jgi:hypothetical protein
MRIVNGMAVLALLVLAAPPALADPLSGPAARLDAEIDAMVERGDLLAGVVTEQDVGLLFEHLRAALIAAAAGREPPPATRLNRRAEEIARELKARGLLGGLLLLEAAEARARQWLRENPSRRPALPPQRSYTPV